MKQFYTILDILLSRKRAHRFFKSGFCWVLLLCFNGLFSNGQSINISNISTTTICAGSTMTIAFTVTNGPSTPYFTSTTSYTAYISDASGANFTSFNTFTTNGGYSAIPGGTSAIINRSFTIPGKPFGTGYKIALSSTSPTFNGSTGAGASPAFTININPTLTAVTQAANVICFDTTTSIPMTMNLTNLIPGSISTVNYNINGVSQLAATGVIANGSGTASFSTSSLTYINNGQTLEVKSIYRTDVAPSCSTTNFTGKVVALSLSPYLNKTFTADPDSVCELNGSVIKVFSPDPRVKYQLRNNFDNSLVGVSLNSIISPLKLPIPIGYLTATTTFNIVATDTTTGCSAQLPGTATVKVKTTGVTYPSVNIIEDYCSLGNGFVKLSSDNPFSSYLWSNDSTQDNIIINQSGIFSLTVSDANGCRATQSVNIGDELVVNGNFNMGVGIGYSTQYIYTSAPGGLQTPGAGYYSIYTDARYTSGGFWGKDHTTQTGNFMIINGSGTPSKEIWTTKVKVIPNTRYFFSAWAMSLNAVGPFAKLQFNVNGVNVGSVATLTAGVGNNSNNGWLRFYGAWDSGSNNDSIKIKIVDLETSNGGNDFGLDDISFSSLPPVTFFGASVGNGGNSVCINDTLSLTATLTGGSAPLTYDWSGPSGFTSTDPNPKVLLAPEGWYYLNITEGRGCQSKDSIFIIRADPTLTGASQAATICNGDSVVINITGLVHNSINNTIYYRKPTTTTKQTIAGVNADASGNASFKIGGLTSANNGQTVFIDTIFNGSCKQNVTLSVILSILPTGWVGGASGNWNLASNWCPGLPGITTNVSIPTGTTIFINANESVNCQNITLSGTASLVINKGKLTIYGTISTPSTGKINAGTGDIEMKAAGAQNISGRNFVGNNLSSLIISNTNTTTGKVTVLDSLRILSALNFGNTTADLITSDTLILCSNDTVTARVGQLAAGNVITGKIAVERYFPARRAWRLVTSPLSNTGSIWSNWQNRGVYTPGGGTHITGPNPTVANGLDVSVTNNSSLKTGVNLAIVTDTKGMNLSNNTSSAANIGYFLFVRGDRNPANINTGSSNITTISSKGNLQTGTQTFMTATSAKDAYTLIGNPYASPVYFRSVTRNNVINRFVVWDPYLNQVGGYVVVEDPLNLGNYSYTPQRVGGQDSIIQSSQAFFVQNAAAGMGSVVFNEVNKSPKINSGLFRPASPTGASSLTHSIRVNLFLNNGSNSLALADGTLAQFNDKASAGVDNIDAVKFYNVNEMVSFQRNNTLLAVERRPLIKQDDTLFLQLLRTSQRKYRLEVVPEKFDNPLLSAFLEDNFTGKATPLNLASSNMYDFAITADAKSAAANRFRIVFKQVSAGPLPVTYKSVKAYKQANNIAVEWTVENEINISKYEVEKSEDGVSFTKVNATTATGANRTSTTYTWLDIKPLSGNNFYRIRSVSPDGGIEYSNVMLVKMGNAPSGISVYPNPVVNGIIGAEFKNMPSGVYRINLINQLGQTVFSKTINHAAGSSLQSIQPDNKLAPGIYQMEVTAPDHQSNPIKVIVQ